MNHKLLWSQATLTGNDIIVLLKHQSSADESAGLQVQIVESFSEYKHDTDVYSDYLCMCCVCIVWRGTTPSVGLNHLEITRAAIFRLVAYK